MTTGMRRLPRGTGRAMLFTNKTNPKQDQSQITPDLTTPNSGHGDSIMTPTRPAPHSSHLPQSQAQQAFPPIPQILGGGGGGAMTARRFPPFIPALLAACLVAGLSEALAADFVIDRPVTTTNGGNTLNGDDTLTVNAGGAITTSGNGISATGTGNTIVNNGSINTSGRSSEGIDVDDRNTITNNGSISTSSISSEGIDARSGNIIVNNGSISTSSNFSEGIYAEDRNIITNNGSITTSGINTGGIDAGIENTITNSGAITTSGNLSEGIDAQTGNTVINTGTGTITTSGNFSDGIYGHINSPLLANDGIILTRGEQAHGIRARTNNTVRNSGTITTHGTGASGVWMTNNNTLTLNGAITTKGRGAHGVRAGTGTKLNPIGPNSRIQTMAADADGLRIDGLAGQTTLIHRGHIEAGGTGIRLPYVPMFDNSGHILGMNGAGLHFTMVTGPMTLTNTGTIAGRTGIRIDRTGMGADATIDNAGALRSLLGVSGVALDFRGRGQDTLYLRAGSALAGQIRWDGEGDTLRLEGRGPARLTVTDNDAPANTQPTRFKVKTPTGLPVLRSTTTSGTVGEARTILTVLDPARTDPRTDATQSLWTGAVFQSLAQQQARMSHTGSARHRSGHDVLRSALWVRPFGGLQNYKREAETPATRYRYGGALAGYGMATAEWQAGAFVGAARSALQSRGEGIEVEGREVFLGAYGQTRWQALEVSVAVLFGKSRSERAWQRRNNLIRGGLERVVYAGQRYFLSPELGVSTRLNLRGIALIPELKLRYLGLFDAEARERTGQADGLVFKPEDRHIGLIRASVGFPLRFPENQYGGQLSGHLRLGAEGRRRLGGDRIAVRSGNDTVRYRAGGDDAVMGFVGAGFEYGVSVMNLSFSADVEAGYDSEAAFGVRGQLGFVWGF